MGLTINSVGANAASQPLPLYKLSPGTKVVAIAGNPNVGKSTVFNALTGQNQHTGNWPGKTVTVAHGFCKSPKNPYVLVDIPGTYSLMAHSAEEEVARNFICFEQPDAIVVVCDAGCLERNLNLVLQILEISSNVIVCVNLLDEAKRRHIQIDLPALSQKLGVPVVGTVARDKKTLSALLTALDTLVETKASLTPYRVTYSAPIEEAIALIEPLIGEKMGHLLNPRWFSLRLLDCDFSLEQELAAYLGFQPFSDKALLSALDSAKSTLADNGISSLDLKDSIVSKLVFAAETLCQNTVTRQESKAQSTDQKIDRIFTSRWAGYPVMLLLLALVFWLTIAGANYPSQLLSDLSFWLQNRLTDLFQFLHAPDWLHGILILGVYRVTAWVVSVMLPPMAIFFPLFTMLEDSGYLPRIAYNLDKPFKRCCACGKQALTMCMGFGCNAAGIVGCRIIDSPRERLIAMITNSFVPCNGRFPTLIAIISMFFIGTAGGFFNSLSAALFLTLFILLGIGMTFLVSSLLSKTILKGVPSSFTLELPPYRMPQIGKVIVHSVFDRTLFVLGRSILFAAPAGLILWLMANITPGGVSLLSSCASFLNPFAQLLGLDGVILIAFILGLPANEIVIPIIIMAYMAKGSILELDSLSQLKELLTAHGWTWSTAVSTMLFSLMHWPCSTTLLTIKKESGSVKWMIVSFVIPTVIGIMVCFLFTSAVRLSLSIL